MKNRKSIIVVIMIVLAVVLVGTSYALWQITLKQESTNIVTTGCFRIEFQDSNPINLQEALPITDEEGKTLIPYEFTLTNTCNSYASYQVNLEVLNNTTMENLDYIKVQYEEDIPQVLTENSRVNKTLDNAKTAYKLKVGTLNKNESVTLHLRLWLSEEMPTTEEFMNKIFESKVTITLAYDGLVYKESILNGTDPVLKEGLIPVKIANDGTVTKASVEEEWYNYQNKEWANAVILKDETVSYENGDVIPEDNIESYFVWIPRYRYKIFNDETYSGLTEVEDRVQTIEVEFESKNTPPSNGTKKNEWLTHPAFISFNSNGMWVGKFETSKSNTAPDNSINAVGIQIKPNVVSYRNIQVGNAFYTSYAYKREMDSHMMKNSEWGSVAYLQHSKYGSQMSVRFNNNSNFITGYSSVVEPTCGYTNDNRVCNKYGTTNDITLPYNTETGYLASTTGNISGIYDMSGGAWEYVMGIMTDSNGKPLSGRNASNHSGFIGGYGEGGSLASGYSWPEEKYYDKYAYGTSYSEFTRGHLGDATVEMGPFKSIIYANNQTRQISSWYADHAYFVYTATPWVERGGAYRHGSDTGVFGFDSNYGSVNAYNGFRVVLAP